MQFVNNSLNCSLGKKNKRSTQTIKQTITKTTTIHRSLNISSNVLKKSHSPQQVNHEQDAIPIMKGRQSNQKQKRRTKKITTTSIKMKTNSTQKNAHTPACTLHKRYSTILNIFSLCLSLSFALISSP